MECLFIKKVYIQNISVSYFARYLSYICSFFKKQIASIIHKVLFPKIFWVFRNVTSEFYRKLYIRGIQKVRPRTANTQTLKLMVP